MSCDVLHSESRRVRLGRLGGIVWWVAAEVFCKARNRMGGSGSLLDSWEGGGGDFRIGRY